MTNTMPKTVTVTRTFTYDVANWIAQYEFELADGGGQHPHNHNEYDVRYIIPTLNMQRSMQCNNLAHIINVTIHQANAVTEQNTGKLLEYRQLIKGADKEIWKKLC